MTLPNKAMFHHIKETAITLIPAGIGTSIWLNNIHTIIGIAAGIGSCVYLGIRIAIAWKEFKSKH